MDNNERKLYINQRGTLPGMGTPRPPIAVSRTVTFPEISIAEMERDLADDEAFEEFESSETIEVPVPKADDDFEGPTDIFEIGTMTPDGRNAAEGDHGPPAQDAGRRFGRA
jgi:hypothetical protein